MNTSPELRENKETTLIGVYGTLRKGFGNHGLLIRCGAKYVGIGHTKELMKLVASGIPFLSRESKVSHVIIEVYEIPNENLHLVDGLEGHPDWYKRDYTTIIMEDKSELDVQVYFNEVSAKESRNVLIESGDYKEYRYA